MAQKMVNSVSFPADVATHGMLLSTRALPVPPPGCGLPLRLALCLPYLLPCFPRGGFIA